MLNFEKNTATTVIYQALLTFIVNETVYIEPIDENFLELYEYGCPFCGSGNVPDVLALHTCPNYSMGDYISDDECASFGDDGACKYCITENQESLGECYCCSDCGIGIRLETMSLIYHAISPITDNEQKTEQAREFLKIHKFLNLHGDANHIIRSLGIIEQVYKIDLDRKETALVDIEIVKEYINQKNKIT